ncbi:hypothetical protein MTO96_013560 [Rhipicephalus appendiculatus]
MPPIAHCVAFCGAFGLVFAVSGAVLLSSGLPYRRLQLRIISASEPCTEGAPRRQRRAALVIRVPTISGTYVYTPTPGLTEGGAAPSRPPPPAYEDVVLPPPSYESVMMLKQLEKAAGVAHQMADITRRDSAPGAADT